MQVSVSMLGDIVLRADISNQKNLIDVSITSWWLYWAIEISLGGLQMVLIHPGFYEMVLIHPRLIHVTLPYGVVVFQIHLTTGLVCASTVLRIFHGCWLLMFLVSSFTTCFTLTV